MRSTGLYNLLIVDPDIQGRSKLLHAAKASEIFDRAYCEDNLKDALELSESKDDIDLVVLSHRFETEDIIKFVEEAKENFHGEDWAYMIVLKPTEQSGENIAANIISGIDGILFDPFSADDLHAMAQITEQVKKQNEEKRMRTALSILMKDIMGHIDAAALLKSKGMDPTSVLKTLRQSCESLKKFTGDSYELYIDIVSEFFEKALPPPTVSYDGPSERLKKRLEQKALAELEEKYGNIEEKK